MLDFIKSLNDFNFTSIFIRLIIATIVGGIIGSERGRHGSAAGMRTHILVCIGSAMTALTGIYLTEYVGIATDATRLAAQVVSGIGFLGVGTILVRNSSVITGLTTAAGMWATAAIGIAIGYGFYTGAIIAAVICFITVAVLNRLEKSVRNVKSFYIELKNIEDTQIVVERIRNVQGKIVSCEIVPAKSGHTDNVGIVTVIKENEHLSELEKQLKEDTSVVMFLRNVGI